MRILLFTWEAGGATGLIPIAQDLIAKNCEIFECCLEPARKIILSELSDNVTSIKLEQVESLNVDVLLVTLGHPKNKTAMLIWKKLSKLLPSYSICDHWKGLDRFFKEDGEKNDEILPDRIGVIDESVKNILYQKGISKDRLVITGLTAAHNLTENLSGISVDSVKKKLGLQKYRKIYFLASETLHDHSFFDSCTSSCLSLQKTASNSGESVYEYIVNDALSNDALLVVRPHPNQPESTSENVITHIDWSKATDNEILAISDRIYGLSSMLLLKAVVLDKDTVNLASIIDDFVPGSVFVEEEIWNYSLYSNSGFDTNISHIKEASNSVDIEKIYEELNSLK